MLRDWRKKFSFEERCKRGERVDWHVHTTASDGRLSPTQVVELAKKIGLKEIAVSDHDSTDGIQEATETGRKLGVVVVPSVELGAFDNVFGRETELHFLGLDVDYKNPVLNKALEKSKRSRVKRVKSMVEKLRALGYRISFRQVAGISGNGAMARPHVARALLSFKENKKKMRKDFKLRRGPSWEDLFKYLIGRNAPAYVKRTAFSPAEAIRLVKKADGIPVLAHPGFFEAEKPPVKQARRARLENTRQVKMEVPVSKIVEYKRLGLKGIEAFHPEHSKRQMRFYARVAKKLRLIATGGSDFHGIPGQKNRLGKIVH